MEAETKIPNPNAFPVIIPFQTRDHNHDLITDYNITEGMTLRDYFAAKALNGILAKYNLKSPEDQETVCKLSWELADEMLKHRPK